MEMHFAEDGVKVRGRLVGAVRSVRPGSVVEDASTGYSVKHEEPRSYSPLVALLGCLYAPEHQTRLIEVFAWTPVATWLLAGTGELTSALADDIGSGAFAFPASMALDRLRAILVERADDVAALCRWAELILGLDKRDTDDGLWDIDDDVEPLKTWARTIIGTATPRVVFDVFDHIATPSYETDDLIALAAIEVGEWSRRRRALCICPLCKTPWFPDHANERFCGRPAPGEPLGGRTCKQRGPQLRYHDDVDPLTYTYRLSYKRLERSKARGQITIDQLDEWRLAARPMLARAKTNGLNAAEYASQLTTIEPTRQPSEGPR